MEDLIAAAIDVAHRQHRSEATPDHVVAAIAANPIWWRQRIVPVVYPELQRRIDERLTSYDVVVSYRESYARPHLSASAITLFAPSKWLKRPANLSLVLKRLDTQSTLFVDAMADVHDLAHEYRFASAAAAARMHGAVHIEHLIWSLRERVWFDRALRLVSGDRERLITNVNERLKRIGHEDESDPPLGSQLATYLVLSELDGRVPTVDAILEQALDDPPVQQYFADSGASVPALRSLLANGTLVDGGGA